MQPSNANCIRAGGRAKGAAPKKTWKGDKAAARGGKPSGKPSGKPAAGGKRKPFKGGMQKGGQSGRKPGGNKR